MVNRYGESVTIERRSTSVDNAGFARPGFAESSTGNTMWRQPRTGSQAVAAGRDVEDKFVVFYCDTSVDVQVGDRLVISSRYYDVTLVRKPGQFTSGRRPGHLQVETTYRAGEPTS